MTSAMPSLWPFSVNEDGEMLFLVDFGSSKDSEPVISAVPNTAIISSDAHQQGYRLKLSAKLVDAFHVSWSSLFTGI